MSGPSWKNQRVKIYLMRAMVEDGAVPLLEVGDTWSVDLMFLPDLPMVRTTTEFELGIWPLAPLDADPTPKYHVTANVLRHFADGDEREWTAIEMPGLTLGYQSTFPLPEGRRVHGSGIVRADPWANLSWIFPETSRRCTVEGLTRINVPLVHLEDGRFYPDWPRLERRSIEQIRIREDFPIGRPDMGFYSVQIALL